MKKNHILTNITITSLGYGGVGIARLSDGKKILIKGALPQSIVDVAVVKKKKDYVEGRIVRVHSVDEQWLDGEVKCPHYMFSYERDSHAVSLQEHKKGCGGCKWQVVGYARQLELKHAIVKDCFGKVAHAHGSVDVAPVLPSPLQRGYRNKIEFSFGKYLKKETSPQSTSSSPFAIAEDRQVGFHKQGEFSKIVDIDQCYLISSAMHEVFVTIKERLKLSGLPVHDVVTHQGLLRHLVIREGVHTGQILVNLAIAPGHFMTHPEDEHIRQELLASWKMDGWMQEHITTLVITHNDGLADIVQGPDASTVLVWGEGRIFEGLHFVSQENTSDTVVSNTTETLMQREQIVTKFQISPFSFFQTNTTGAQVLFTQARDMIGRVPGNVIDLYCGSGSIGLSFVAQGIGQRVKGIEVVASAVHDAYENAKINSLHDRADFYIGKAEQLLAQGVIDETFFVGEDLIVVDPPREGLHPKVIDFLLTCRQRFGARLLYISCNPITMARDIDLLLTGGYRLGMLQPVDMFPHTHHIEVIGVLR